MSEYQRLDPARVAATARSVCDRIQARFPERQLRLVAREVLDAVERASTAQQRPLHRRLAALGCTVLAALLSIVSVIAVLIVARDALRGAGQRASFDWLPVIESAINDVAFAAIGVYFLVTLGGRLERRALLAELHRLRSLAHVVDMHQLTKDPERLLSQPEPTAASVSPAMTPSDLGRYLDYCSELLSLVAKAAALYAQHSTDALVLDTVSEIEALTVGLSRKVWQKIALLHTVA